MRLQLVEDNYYDEIGGFKVLKNYIRKKFTPNKWNGLVYDWKEIDKGWIMNVKFTNTNTGDSLTFGVEYKDPYDGILYISQRGSADKLFYSQQEAVDYLADEVDYWLY